MSQSFSDLDFEGFVPPFKIGNMVWFWHDSVRVPASDFRQKRAGALREGRGIAWVLPQTLPEGVRSLHGEAEAPQAARFSNVRNRKAEIAERS